MSINLDPRVFNALLSRLEKLAYVPPGPPPPAGMPMGDPSQAAAAPMGPPPPGAPGMDPAAAGGMPPSGDPAAAGMDPNMMAALAGAMGGAGAPPPGMPPPGMDPNAPAGGPATDASAQNNVLVEKLDTMIDLLKQMLEKSGNPQAKTLITPEATAAAGSGGLKKDVGTTSEEQPSIDATQNQGVPNA